MTIYIESLRETPLGRLRWYVSKTGERELQEGWRVERFKDGGLASIKNEWRGIPEFREEEYMTLHFSTGEAPSTASL